MGVTSGERSIASVRSGGRSDGGEVETLDELSSTSGRSDSSDASAKHANTNAFTATITPQQTSLKLAVPRLHEIHGLSREIPIKRFTRFEGIVTEAHSTV